MTKVFVFRTMRTVEERKNLTARLTNYLLAKCPNISGCHTVRRPGKSWVSVRMSDTLHNTLQRAAKHYRKPMSVVVNAALYSTRTEALGLNSPVSQEVILRLEIAAPPRA